MHPLHPAYPCYSSSGVTALLSSNCKSKPGCILPHRAFPKKRLLFTLELTSMSDSFVALCANHMESIT